MFAELVLAEVVGSLLGEPPSTVIAPSIKAVDYWLASAGRSNVRLFDLATKKQIGCTIPKQTTQLCRGLIAYGPLSEDIRQIWVTSKWSELPSEVPKAHYAKILVRYDCKRATYQEAAVTMFERNGKIIDGNSALREAKSVPPGTMIEEEFRMACGLKEPEPIRHLGNVDPGPVLEKMLERAEGQP